MALIDLTGQRFARLAVLSRGPDVVRPSGAREVAWVCRCDCGTEKLIRSTHLRSGSIRSCGCLFREVIAAHNVLRQTKPVVSYSQAHLRLKKKRGKAAEHLCEDCKVRPAVDWSYDGRDPAELYQPRVDGPGTRVYSLKLEHYAPRCKTCHEVFDMSLRRSRALTEAAR